MRAVWRLTGNEKMLLRHSENRLGGCINYFGRDFSDDIALGSLSYCCGYRCINGSGIRWRDERTLQRSIRHGSSWLYYCLYIHLHLAT